MDDFTGRTVVLGVGGGIAAYKACELVRLFVKGGGQVRVAMTRAATRFVGPLTLQALTGAPVLVDVLELQDDRSYGHLELARAAGSDGHRAGDGNLLARLRAGMGDDRGHHHGARLPGALPPRARHEHAHVAERGRARERGRAGAGAAGTWSDRPPGELADGDVGEGRLAEPEEIAAAAARLLGTRDLTGGGWW